MLFGSGMFDLSAERPNRKGWEIYELGQKSFWAVPQAVAWDEPVREAPEVAESIAAMLSFLCPGEKVAVTGASHISTMVRSEEAKFYFALQAVEEAKHYEAMRRIVPKITGRPMEPPGPWVRLLYSFGCWCRDNPDECPADVASPNPLWGCPARGWQPGFTDQPFMLNGNTFSIACGDVDNDGDLDLYTGEIAHPDVGSSSDVSELLLNETESSGDVHFARPGRDAMGLVPPVAGVADEGGQNSGLWDFDDDGRLDPYLGGSPYPDNFGWLFHQTGPLEFEWIGADAGFYPPCPHGVALADFDHDGDQDLVTGTYAGDFPNVADCTDLLGGTQPVRFFENVSNEHDWTSIRLVGAGRATGGANRAAIGARVRVVAGDLTQTAEVNGSWGRGALSRDLAVHFGLGTSCRIDRIEVRWPDAAGSTEVFEDVPANYRLEIRQGEGRVRYLE